MNSRSQKQNTESMVYEETKSKAAVHLASLQGERSSNEDSHTVYTNLSGKDKDKGDVNFFAVFDGHGGKYVSKFLENNLPQFFINKSLKYPLTREYIDKVYNGVQQKLRSLPGKEAHECGSTCCAVIEYKKDNDKYLQIINTGDSRAVLCNGNNIAKQLTLDHKPDWPEEVRRISKLGGVIRNQDGTWRIKDLSVSRAFGDVNASKYVTHIGDIFETKINSNDKFMVIACDGLWDELSNQDVVNFVLNNCYDSKLENRINNDHNIARKLAEHAINEGSGDNVTAVVVFFK